MDELLEQVTKKAPREAGLFEPAIGLLIAYAVVIAPPPIRASGIEGPHAQPSAVVIGVVVWAVDPNPYTIAEDPMATTMVKVVVMIVTALRKTAVVTAITVIHTAS